MQLFQIQDEIVDLNINVAKTGMIIKNIVTKYRSILNI